jgi:hypothetical protein
MINEVNQNGKSAQDSYLKTKKKGNVTVNPKKEDLMSELFQKNLRNALQEIKQQAKQAVKEAPGAGTGTSATTTDGTKEVVKKKTPASKNTGDVKPEAPTACEEIDDSEAKKEIAERMRQRLVALTQEHDRKFMIDIADPK